MKHNRRITAEILGLTFVSLVIGIFITPRAMAVFSGELDISPTMYGVLILTILAVTAVMWLKMMKNMKPEHIDLVFSFGIGAITSKTFSLFFPGLFYSNNVLVGLTVRGVCIFGFWYLYLKLIRAMQKSWKKTRQLSIVNNAIMVVCLPVAATIIAIDMSPIIALAVLFFAAVYDAWAVWKSKTMVKMAKFFIGRRMVPGIGIPKRTEKQGFAILGGGDIFFIVMVATTFWTINPVISAIMSASMFTSLVVLFVISEKKKFYPALPFIFVGAVVGIGISWMTCGLGGLLCVL